VLQSYCLSYSKIQASSLDCLSCTAAAPPSPRSHNHKPPRKNCRKATKGAAGSGRWQPFPREWNGRLQSLCVRCAAPSTPLHRHTNKTHREAQASPSSVCVCPDSDCLRAPHKPTEPQKHGSRRCWLLHSSSGLCHVSMSWRLAQQDLDWLFGIYQHTSRSVLSVKVKLGWFGSVLVPIYSSISSVALISNISASERHMCNEKTEETMSTKR
jgi:hypothetical protein